MESSEGTMDETQSSQSVSTKLRRIAKLAKDHRGEALTNLAHYIDLEWLREAFRRTRKDGAVGIDGQTAAEYAENLEGNLQDLLDRAKSGDKYRAPAVRRVHIPKGSGSETRPIGIPTFEDKVLQRAVAMVLEAVYEQDFVDTSYGFRPGRSAHQALDRLWQYSMSQRGAWVVELDIRKFFDMVDRGHLREILHQRIRDGVLLRLIGKWLRAGVQEDGTTAYPERGTPQGGVVSPVLANIYLHTVLDTWFRDTVGPRLRGRCELIRFADDATLIFSNEEDARRVLEVLPRRFGKFGLSLHPEKTRLVAFQPPDRGDPRRTGGPRDGEPPATFDFLGFTHFWGRSRRGNWVVKRKTARSRFSRTLRTLGQWCRRHRHDSTQDQRHALSAKLRGHYAYFGITGNSAALSRLNHLATRIWFKWLNRRSQRRSFTWDRFSAFLKRHPLPPPRALHSILARGANP